MEVFLDRRCSRGFTLTEVLIVISIMGILMAIALPNFLKWLEDTRLSGVARQLYSEMQSARMEAIKNNASRAIGFDPTENQYVIYSGPGPDKTWSTLGDNTVQRTISLTNISREIKFLQLTDQQNWGLSGNISATSPPGSLPGNGISYSNDLLIFNSRGGCNAGYVYLRNAKKAIFASGTQSTGLVMIKKWTGATWQ